MRHPTESWLSGPMQWDRDEAQTLLETLVRAYPEPSSARTVVERLEADAVGRINWAGSTHEVWRGALDELGRRGRTTELVSYALQDEGVGAFHERLRSLLGAGSREALADRAEDDQSARRRLRGGWLGLFGAVGVGLACAGALWGRRADLPAELEQPTTTKDSPMLPGGRGPMAPPASPQEVAAGVRETSPEALREDPRLAAAATVLKQVGEHIAAANLPAALSDLETALHLCPDQPLLHLLRSGIAYTAEEYELCISDLTAVIDAVRADLRVAGPRATIPEATPPRGLLALALYGRASARVELFFERNQDWDEWFETMVRARGHGGLSEPALDAALADLEEAITLSPSYLNDLHYQVGRIQFVRAVPDKAREAWSRVALEKLEGAERIKFLTSIAWAWRAEGRLAEAIGAVDQAVEQGGDDPYPLLRRASWRAQAGDRLGARNDFAACLERWPRNLEALWGHARLVADDDPEQAIGDMTIAVAVSPAQSWYSFAFRAEMHLELGNWEEALADCNRSLARRRTAVAFYLRARARRRRGEHPAAVQDLCRALEEDPNLPGAHYLRADSERALGRWHAAIRDYTLAIQRQPTLEKAYHWRAVVKEHIGDAAGAAADRAEARRFGHRISRE